MLSDGYLSMDEKHLILKLAAIIGLDDQAPLAIYEAVVAGEKIEDGDKVRYSLYNWADFLKSD